MIMIRATTATHPITMPTIASVESPLDDDDAGAIGALIVVTTDHEGSGSSPWLPESMVMDVEVGIRDPGSGTVGKSGYCSKVPIKMPRTPVVYATVVAGLGGGYCHTHVTE